MAFNSTILSRIGKCIDCVAEGDTLDKEIIAKRCKYKHYKLFQAKKQAQKQREKYNIRKLNQLPQNKSIAEDKAPDKALEHWFLERRKEMTGTCICGCNQPSSKNDDKYFKFSIAHVLPKKTFKSIATHPENWVELAFFGGCHSTMDDKGYDYVKQTKPLLWAQIIKKIIRMYPMIALHERVKIPEVIQIELEMLEVI